MAFAHCGRCAKLRFKASTVTLQVAKCCEGKSAGPGYQQGSASSSMNAFVCCRALWSTAGAERGDRVRMDSSPLCFLPPNTMAPKLAHSKSKRPDYRTNVRACTPLSPRSRVGLSSSWLNAQGTRAGNKSWQRTTAPILPLTDASRTTLSTWCSWRSDRSRTGKSECCSATTHRTGTNAYLPFHRLFKKKHVLEYNITLSGEHLVLACTDG